MSDIINNKFIEKDEVFKETVFNNTLCEYLTDFKKDNLLLLVENCNIYQQNCKIRKLYNIFEYIFINKDIFYKNKKYVNFQGLILNKIQELKTNISKKALSDCNYKYLFDMFENVENIIR